MAVERNGGGNGWCRIRRGGLEKLVGSGWCIIRRGGLEKCVWSSNLKVFPSTVGDVDVKGLDDQEFDCPVWREGGCGAGAGEGELEGGRGGGSCARACVSY